MRQLEQFSQYVSFSLEILNYAIGSQYVKHNFGANNTIYQFDRWVILEELSMDCRVKTDSNLQVIPDNYLTVRFVDPQGVLLPQFQNGEASTDDASLDNVTFNRTVNLNSNKTLKPNLLIGGIKPHFLQMNFPYVTVGALADVQLNMNAFIRYPDSKFIGQ